MLHRTLDGWERDCFGPPRFWGVPPHPSWATLTHYLRIRKVEKGIFLLTPNEFFETSYVKETANKYGIVQHENDGDDGSPQGIS